MKYTKTSNVGNMVVTEVYEADSVFDIMEMVRSVNEEYTIFTNKVDASGRSVGGINQTFAYKIVP